MAEDDVPAARDAVNTARLAAPYDEILCIEVVAVMVAEAHPEVAARALIDDVSTALTTTVARSSFPAETAELIASRNWLAGAAGAAPSQPLMSAKTDV